MKKTFVLLGLMSLLLVGCMPSGSETKKGNDVVKEETTESGSGETTQLANPAAENCVAVGGQSIIKDTLIDGEKFGQYGVCEFEEGRLCEEWALFNGDCPEGGVKVTGYVTDAAVFCAITGGEYAVTGMSGETYEQGTCTGADGKECEVWDYYRGACSIK